MHHLLLGAASTLRNIIVMLKDAGVKEIHLKISSPPIKYSCFYGIDTPERKDLIAASQSIKEIEASIRMNTSTNSTISYLVQKEIMDY